MRAASFLGVILFVCTILVFTPAMTPGQQGGKKGKGGGGFDPGSIFDSRAAGRASIPLAEVPTRRQDELAQYVKDKGITNGQLTKQQYLDFVAAATAKMLAPPGGGGGAPVTPGGGGGGPKMTFPAPGGGTGGPIEFGGGFFKKKGGGEFGGGAPPIPGLNPSLALNPEAINAAADIEFRRRDQNGDGKLNFEEMPQDLRRGLGKWDKNGDTFVDRDEYREYFMARILGSVDDMSGAKGVASIIVDEEELDRKVVVFRAGGKMPVGLPPWFSELDVDKDGQIALWEWRKGGKDVEDFPRWDLNDDGYITPEEGLRTQNALGKTSGSLGANGEETPFFGKGGGKKKGGFGGGPPGDGNGERPAWGGGNPGGGAPPWGGGNPPWGGKGNKGGKKGKDQQNN